MISLNSHSSEGEQKVDKHTEVDTEYVTGSASCEIIHNWEKGQWMMAQKGYFCVLIQEEDANRARAEQRPERSDDISHVVKRNKTQ